MITHIQLTLGRRTNIYIRPNRSYPKLPRPTITSLPPPRDRTLLPACQQDHHGSAEQLRRRMGRTRTICDLLARRKERHCSGGRGPPDDREFPVDFDTRIS